MSLSSKQEKILKNFIGKEYVNLYKNFSLRHHRVSVKLKKVIQGYASVYSGTEKGIAYYNDFIKLPVVGLSLHLFFKTEIDYYKIDEPFFLGMAKPKILEALSELFSQTLEKKRDVDIARFFGFTEEDIVIPNGFELHEPFDETEYNFEVVDYRKDGDNLALEINFWIKTYPLLGKSGVGI
jgi:hypothetical protein